MNNKLWQSPIGTVRHILVLSLQLSWEITSHLSYSNVAVDLPLPSDVMINVSSFVSDGPGLAACLCD